MIFLYFCHRFWFVPKPCIATMIFISLIKPHDLLRTKLSVIMIGRKIYYTFVVLIYHGSFICYHKAL